jgi:hypothetical protein
VGGVGAIGTDQARADLPAQHVRDLVVKQARRDQAVSPTLCNGPLARRAIVDQQRDDNRRVNGE